MSNKVFAILVSPFILFAFYLFVWFCHWSVDRFLPNGRIKRLLTRRFEIS